MDEFSINADSEGGGRGWQSASSWVLVMMVSMVMAGGLAFVLFKPKPGSPPIDIASNPLLVRGRTLFVERCASCHGEAGVGDGPVAAINEVPPGNLTDDQWKHGDQPQDVLRVIRDGLQGAMPGWDKTFGEPDQFALAAYVYYLAGREIPTDLLGPTPDEDQSLID